MNENTVRRDKIEYSVYQAHLDQTGVAPPSWLERRTAVAFSRETDLILPE